MAKNAHLEALAEPLTAEENGLMEANRDSEHTAPEAEAEEVAAAPVKQPELALEAEEHDEGDAPEIDPKTGKQRVVNYGALHSERKKRQAAEADVVKAREDFAKLSGRIEVLQQLAQRQQPQQAAQETVIPDVNVDPVGHFQAKFAESERKLQDVTKWRETQDANATAMNNVRELTGIAMRHETEFSKTTPDYQDAAAYVREARDKELDYMGYKDPAVRNQIIQQDALQIAAQALQGNLNAAEVVYNIAKARGYQAKAAALVAPIAPAKSPDAVKIATVAKGQAATQSLGQVNGESVPDLSPDAILKMSDAEFTKWASDDNWRKLMGG